MTAAARREKHKKQPAPLTSINHEKSAEQRLALSEQRFRRLYQTTQDGIMARDVEGKMIDCNPAYAKMLGYTKKELKQKTIKELLPQKWHEQRERIAKKVLNTGHSIVFEREYRRKDGSVFPASVRTWPLTNSKGASIGIWSIVRDISEQKALQRSLQKDIENKAKQLKDSERLIAIGQTAGMVGHDLRNPLQTLIGELYLARAEAQSLPAGDAQSNLLESIRIIEEQTIYMDKIVSDLQAFVQPIRVDKKPLIVKELIGNVLALISIPRSITVHTTIPEDLPIVVGDVNLLKRVLINLATNAVQAMPEGGNLKISAQMGTSNKIAITVEDSGVGISESIKDHIFTPLFTTKPRGQGFGLAVCKRVIEAHDGIISFTSAKGKGTKFTIAFPIE